MAKSQSLMERATRANDWAREFVKQIIVPTTLAAVATAIGTLFLIMTLTFNTWINSQQQVIESLRTENKLIRERSAGLLQETHFRVDTLQPTVTRPWVDTNLVKLVYRRKIRLQGSLIAFRFYHRTRVLWADLFADNLIKVDYENRVDGILTAAQGKSSDQPLDRTYSVPFTMELGRDRYDFTALGRKYYLYCERLCDDPDSLQIVTTIMALDPIYTPTLGL